MPPWPEHYNLKGKKMTKRADFIVLRYSLVEEAQQALIVDPLPDPKGSAIAVALFGDSEFSRNNVSYAFVGFAKVHPTPLFRFQENRYLAGKVAKLRKAQVHEKVPGDIIKHEADDWVPLVAIFDLYEQYVFVQRDWKFGTETQIASAIQTGLREPVLAKYNHRVFVEPKTRTEDFWSVVETHKRIYKLEIRLISPNILRTNERARDALEELKKIYGQEEISLTLENESGNLLVPRVPVADYIDYAAEGEGKWTLVTEGIQGGKKKHTSDEAAITLDLPVPSEDDIYSEGQLEIQTGAPAPGRGLNDAYLVAELLREVSILEKPRDRD